jgi:hypothetical protein
MIDLVGSIGCQQVPVLAPDAAMFALPTRDGVFSGAGFPTKFVDDLTTGRPSSRAPAARHAGVHTAGFRSI